MTRVTGGVLVLGSLAAGVPAALALSRTWALPDAPATDTELLTGYVGGALGVVAVVCLAFAVLLVVRDLAGRAGPPATRRVPGPAVRSAGPVVLPGGGRAA